MPLASIIFLALMSFGTLPIYEIESPLITISEKNIFEPVPSTIAPFLIYMSF